MKKLLTCSMMTLALCLGKISYGQDGGGKPAPSLSVGVEVGFPMGDFGDGWKIGLGGSAKAAFPIMNDGDITVSAGYISFAGKEIGGIKLPATNVIPLKAGFRYRFPGGFFLEPQVGYSNFKVKGADGSGGFTYAGNIGYLINNMVELTARYEGTSMDGGSLSFFGIRAAYSFSLGGKK